MSEEIYGYENEFADLHFGDKRLDERLVKMMNSFAKAPDKSIFLASGGRSEAKAAYRFLKNENVGAALLLRGAACATKEKIIRTQEKEILCIQDTTAVGFGERTKIKDMGYYCDKDLLGMNVHSCIAVTREGIPLGIMHQQYDTRESRKDTSRTKEQKRSRPIEEKEDYRWIQTIHESREYVPEGVRGIYVCDREGDFYELFNYAEDEKESFVIRIIQNRSTADGEKLMDELRKEPVIGRMYVHIGRDPKRNTPGRDVLMCYTYKKLHVKRPARRREGNLRPELVLTGIYVYEEGVPAEKAIHWFLITNMQINSPEDVEDRIRDYIQRWKIERFHYVLKSGCKICEKQERSYKKLTEIVLLYSVIAMMLMNMLYFGRLYPETPSSVFLEDMEWKLLYRLGNKTRKTPEHVYSVKDAIHYIAKLGGYKGAPSDPEPGLKVLWIGIERLLFMLEYQSYIA